MGEWSFSTLGWNENYPNNYNFIQDLNNEKGDHPEYKERLLKLKFFGMY